ncbi:PRKR-interacting protein 1 homolog [Drosophila obscura]|uniref:PRKR-interacting protein 1 homolog n=1 Tax=Drosophila obscura TaxID=7282 RepID=UPI000BA1042A|nr:PRKR-interacting protein 1 homolog [Drosophila obscura]XP_022227586.1 PRKR-interacting protein 1 homolog [Drosophila obscura]
MSLIKNLVKETENKPKKKKKDAGSGDSDSDGKGGPLRPFVKTATDLQRLKLEKLMKHPEKPVIIPEQRRERDYNASVPTFVRNVMGSSAGAGSGEFHVYRHLRRKEYARQKNIQHQSAREAADDAYQQKIDDNRRLAEERTAKKRAKRLKKKQRAKKPREQKTDVAKPESESSGSASEGEDVEEKPETADQNPDTADPKPNVNCDEGQQRPEEASSEPPETVDLQDSSATKQNET